MTDTDMESAPPFHKRAITMLSEALLNSDSINELRGHNYNTFQLANKGSYKCVHYRPARNNYCISNA